VSPRNLDIEISALSIGWGEWCEEYRAMEKRIAALEAALREIETGEYADGDTVGRPAKKAWEIAQAALAPESPTGT
jgi:hypothetical protein